MDQGSGPRVTAGLRIYLYSEGSQQTRGGPPSLKKLWRTSEKAQHTPVCGHYEPTRNAAMGPQTHY
jgi:hypothetical protein